MSDITVVTTARQDFKIEVSSLLDSDGDFVEWANVLGLKVDIIGNNTRQTLDIDDLDTSTTGVFLFNIEKSFLQLNSFIYFKAEITQTNAIFSDNLENIDCPIDLILNVID
jgi:hypothetical protein